MKSVGVVAFTKNSYVEIVYAADKNAYVVSVVSVIIFSQLFNLIRLNVETTCYKLLQFFQCGRFAALMTTFERDYF